LIVVTMKPLDTANCDEKISLSSALFQAAVLLESKYAAGTQEHLVAEICAQASTEFEELECEIESLKQAMAPSDDHPRR
jgi:hypothetical protein